MKEFKDSRHASSSKQPLHRYPSSAEHNSCIESRNPLILQRSCSCSVCRSCSSSYSSVSWSTCRECSAFAIVRECLRRSDSTPRTVSPGLACWNTFSPERGYEERWLPDLVTRSWGWQNTILSPNGYAQRVIVTAPHGFVPA